MLYRWCIDFVSLRTFQGNNEIFLKANAQNAVVYKPLGNKLNIRKQRKGSGHIYIFNILSKAEQLWVNSDTVAVVGLKASSFCLWVH